MMLLRISSGTDQDFLSRGFVTEPMLRERLRDSVRKQERERQWTILLVLTFERIEFIYCTLGKGAENQNGNLRWHLP